MINQLSDTHPEAEKFQISLIRQASTAKRISRICSLSETVIQLSRRAILRANPASELQEITALFFSYHYNIDIKTDYFKNAVKKRNIMNPPDIIAALEPVLNAFEISDIPYYIGGSVASSAYGIPRATLDVDIICDLKANQVSSLVKTLESAYYIDEEMILDAIQRKSSFNLIHLDTMIKIDIFIMKDTLYDKSAFQRKQKDTLDENRHNLLCYFVSPEDIILNKLKLFHIGGEVSERQWHDVQGVIKVQKNMLDRKYLQYWSAELGIEDLLNRAFQDAEG